jgi:rhamnosyl/mannosyltransferase
MNSAPARILHVGKFYSPHRGGIETHLQLLCGELHKHVDLRVVVASKDRSSHDEVIGGVSVKRSSTWASVSAAPVCPDMIREIRDSRADIVHLHLPNPAAVLAYLASGHKGILICSYHSDIVRQRVLGTAFEPILRRALLRSSAVITASPNYISSSPMLSSVRERCRVIPYGIPLEPFDSPDPAAVQEIRDRYGAPLIIAVGRLVYYKGFQYLVRAMKKARGKLLLVGDGPLRADLEREVRQHGLGDRVVFLGQVEDTIPYYHAAEFFVLPSIARSEAFGIVQLEAMACRKPVINTRLDSGVPFVSVDGITGLTVPPENSEALASAINTLIDNAELRAKYGSAGRKRVEELFTLDAMTAKTLRVYEEVFSGFTRKHAGREERPQAISAGAN